MQICVQRGYRYIIKYKKWTHAHRDAHTHTHAHTHWHTYFYLFSSLSFRFYMAFTDKSVDNLSQFFQCLFSLSPCLFISECLCYPVSCMNYNDLFRSLCFLQDCLFPFVFTVRWFFSLLLCCLRLAGSAV